MKVTDDPFTVGIIADASAFALPFAYGAATKILNGIGTEYERQRYTRDEIEWACKITGKPFDHVNGKPV